MIAEQQAVDRASKQGLNGRKIKSFVFDLGGMLFSEGKSLAIGALIRNLGYDPVVVREVLTCTRNREMRS